jgi:hypothetical protein
MSLSPNKFLKVKDVDVTAGLAVTPTGRVHVALSSVAGNAIELDNTGSLYSAAPVITDISPLPNNAISLIAGMLYAPTVVNTSGIFTRLPTVVASSNQTVVSVLGLPLTYAPTPSVQSSGLLVFLDGILLPLSSYTQTPVDITFVIPLTGGTQVDVLFIGGEFATGISTTPLTQRLSLTTSVLTPTAIEWTNFSSPINVDVNKFTIHVDGIYQSPAFDYVITFASGVPTFNFPTVFPIGAQIDVTY